MPHATRTEHEGKTTSKAEENEARPPKLANKPNSIVEDDKAAPPKPPRNPTAKVEKYEEATTPRPAKKTKSKVDEHTLPHPSLSPKDLYWRCCCEHESDESLGRPVLFCNSRVV